MSKFHLGDEVQLLNSKEKGIIIGINHDTISVDIDGLVIDVNTNEIIFVQNISSKKENPKPTSETSEEKIEEGIYIVLDTETHWVTVYLWNYTAARLHFIANQKDKKLNYIADSVIEPFKIHKIRMVSLDTISKEAKFQFQFLSCFKYCPEENQMFIVDFEPNAKILNKKLQFVKILNKEVILYCLKKNNENENQQSSKIPLYLKKKEPNHQENPSNFEFIEQELVFDLHIEKLHKNPSSLDNFQCLKLQLKKAEEFFYQAIIKKCQKVTFIHGGGKGKLKAELIKLFKDHPNVSSYEVGEIHKYGLGATCFYLDLK